MEFLFPASLGEHKARARAELLAAAIGRRLGIEVEVSVAASYDALAQAVAGATVDLAWMPPIAFERAGATARVVLRAVRQGRTSYRAALVGRARDALDPRSLRGKRAAWVDPGSASGYALAAEWLAAQGHAPGRFLGGEKFHGSFRDALMAVLERRADFASVYCHGDDLSAAHGALEELVGPLAKELAPFALTGEARTDAIVVTRRVDAATADKLATMLTTRGGATAALVREACNCEAFVREVG